MPTSPTVAGYLKGWKAMAEPEYPTDKQTDARGWTEVSDTYRRPRHGDAVRRSNFTCDGHRQDGRIEWSEVVPGGNRPPGGPQGATGRRSFQPSGKSAASNRQEAAPLIAEAAKQKADLIVLGETLHLLRSGQVRRSTRPNRCPARRPTTSARWPSSTISTSCSASFERDGHLVYNTAVALGPGREARG